MNLHSVALPKIRVRPATEAGLNSSGENRVQRHSWYVGDWEQAEERKCVTRLQIKTTPGGRVSDKKVEDEERSQKVWGVPEV